MIAPLLAMMLSSAPMPIAFTLPKSPPRRCAGSCADRYRLPASSDDGDGLKDRAVRSDGSKCNVVGARRCTSKPMRILRSTY
ncbi:hypothetical protein [Sphingomonas bacterium]|uniref:hypothetical protein n=1 Tax=Sphingomonas bacterium TaxID=1895847 RepID=UPI0026369347|nr:hypothetical protein [Sphingomonas bacterium]MDB5679650.1 hypothetical protein [Sphingomonas bacterium]